MPSGIEPIHALPLLMAYKARQWTEEQALAVLERIADKDESALAELHEMMAKRIYAFALNRLHDESEAESVVVDTLFAVWQKPRQFRGDSKFSTWVLGIARNKSCVVLGQRAPACEDVDDLADQLESEGLGVFEQVAHSQDRRQIFGCLETLSEAQRECLQLTFYEGYSVNEIAHFQAVPEGTVKTRLFHARKAMKTCLEAAARGVRQVMAGPLGGPKGETP